MRLPFVVCLLILPSLPSRACTARRDPSHSERGQLRLAADYGAVPLSFEPNQGQIDPQVQFVSRGSGYSLFLSPAQAVMVLNQRSAQPQELTSGSVDASVDSTVLRMQLVGANRTAALIGLNQLPGKSNYFIGNDPSRWRTNIPTYAKVRYKSVYPGVDLIFYGNRRQLEFDFVVFPGADPKGIALAFDGVDSLEVVGQGDLVAATPAGSIRLRKPQAFQEEKGHRQEIDAGYVLQGKYQVGFQLGAFDHLKPLVIDPVLAYSTYLGGFFPDLSFSIATDPAGNAYVIGSTQATSNFRAPANPQSFPIVNAFQPAYGGGLVDTVVAKLDPSGSTLVYSTFLGGSGHDSGIDIAVDESGKAYLIGFTDSNDFPTVNPLQPVLKGIDAFVAVLDPAGSALAYSTYLGGTSLDEGFGIAADSAGNAYVTGVTSSLDFPLEKPFQKDLIGICFSLPCFDGFVAMIDPSGSALVYSTYLGGTGMDQGGDIAVDASGNAYVTGFTNSDDFPTANPLQPAPGGFGDAFVAKLNPAGSALLYSTYLGGSDSEFAIPGHAVLGGGQPGAIAVGPSGNAYVTGRTNSTDFPTTPGAFKVDGSGVFVTKFSLDGTSLVYSTLIGEGSSYGISIDAKGNAYLTGDTIAFEFPMVDPLEPGFPFNVNIRPFVAKLDPEGSALVYSTRLGRHFPSWFSGTGFGIALDAGGSAYVTGRTPSFDLPTVNPVQAEFGGDFDAFVVKIADFPSIFALSLSQAPPATEITMKLAGLPTLAADQAHYTLASFSTIPCDPGFSLYQSFTPTAAKLDAVELLMRVGFGSLPDGVGEGLSTSVKIRAGTPAGPELGEAIRPIPLANFTTGSFRFDFPEPVALTPGETYVIEWLTGSAGNGDYLSWQGNRSPDYPGGKAFDCSGGPLSFDFDLDFMTYFRQAEVRFNGVEAAHVTVVDDTTISVAVPPIAPGPADIVVTTAAGTASLPGGPGGFTVEPSPLTITAVSPAAAPPGARITINGTGFFGADLEVHFQHFTASGSPPATRVPGLDAEVVNDAAILVTVPDLTPGPADIIVTTAGGTAILPAVPGGFRVEPLPPTIVAVFPAAGPAGARITIKGTGFSSGDVEVFFNGRAGIDVVVIDDTTISVTVPPDLPPGDVEVTVSTAGGTATLPAGPGGFSVIIAIPALSQSGVALLLLLLVNAGVYCLKRGN